MAGSTVRRPSHRHRMPADLIDGARELAADLSAGTREPVTTGQTLQLAVRIGLDALRKTLPTPTPR